MRANRLLTYVSGTVETGVEVVIVDRESWIVKTASRAVDSDSRFTITIHDSRLQIMLLIFDDSGRIALMFWQGDFTFSAAWFGGARQECWFASEQGFMTRE